jgi:hypothetical protein
MEEPTQELKYSVSRAASHAGWEFTGLQYQGAATSFYSVEIACTHGIRPLSLDVSGGGVMPAPLQTTTLKRMRICNGITGEITPVLAGLCPGGVLHYCDFTP